jgi:hypothetical protein
MSPPGKKTTGSEVARILEALDKIKNPLSEEEIHFIWTCCQIMKISEKEKIESICETAIWEGNGKATGTVAAIQKLLGALGSEAEACRRVSQAPFQTTQNMENLDAPAHSLQYLANSAKGLQDTLQRGFTMGIMIARFDLEKSLEDYNVMLERIAVAAK